MNAEGNFVPKGETVMTGRDLIIYILQNHLEDEPIFKDGKFVGFITDSEAAEKIGVGVSTIHAYIFQRKIDGLLIGNKVYIPANFESFLKEKE